MAGQVQEAQQFFHRQRQRAGIHQRVTEDGVLTAQLLVNHHGDLALAVIERGQQRHRARRQAQIALQAFRRGEAQAFELQQLAQGLDVDAGGGGHRQQHVLAALGIA